MNLDRRTFVRRLAASGLTFSAGLPQILAAGQAPALVTASGAIPAMPCGIMSGDVDGDRAIIWSRTDRPARMLAEYTTHASFDKATVLRGPAALAIDDFTARVDLANLPPGQTISYRVRFEDLSSPGAVSRAHVGRLRTPTREPERDFVFAFSGDEAGQGFGINPDSGGYRLYETMRAHEPDVFIHSGDQIYADGPLEERVTLDDGRVWRNIVTSAKAHVAQTLDDFRGNFAYNLLDENKRRFLAEVPMLVQWDDHETRNNWYPGQIIDDPRYDRERNASVLAAFSNRALREYNPVRPHPGVADRLYRAFDLGPLAEVFMLDLRSYRGPNGTNLGPPGTRGSEQFGVEQMRWLQQRLLHSRATWKIIAADLPIGLVVPDAYPGMPVTDFEGIANADDGPPRGRENAIAELLAFIARHQIVNTVWVTADVHYASAIHYDPARARSGAFLPFWEFVAGPINAGTFGPNGVDATFGAEVKFSRTPEQVGRSPLDGLQFFGLGRVDRRTRALTVALRDLDDQLLFEIELPAA